MRFLKNKFLKFLKNREKIMRRQKLYKILIVRDLLIDDIVTLNRSRDSLQKKTQLVSRKIFILDLRLMHSSISSV